MDVVSAEEIYDIIEIKLNDIHKVINIANTIYESGLVEFSIPDFFVPIETNSINDPLFPLQFQMHNTGQVIDGVQGVNDIDCNVLEAWDITLGDNVTVAVLDQGVEYHEDLENRLISGFTPSNNGNGTPINNGDTHGMNCAGVIGAADNNIGLRGAAPNVNLLSVNIFSYGTTVGDIAKGIKWAANNGADVLSNSWSFTNVACDYTDADIDNAIKYAVTEGRNKKGCVVIFSAGNSGGCVNYPARNNNVLSVGAINNRGELFNYSSRGVEIDVVAPSGETNYLGNIRTLDRMNNSGRVVGNYETKFGGTSASCPLVSGITALVLSVNPNLTQQEVRDIIEKTCQKTGTDSYNEYKVNGRWNEKMGYGLVNAFEAVKLAIGNISGPSTICSSNTVFTLNSLPPNTTITWSTSSNISIVSGQGSSNLTVKANGNGDGTITATISVNGANPIAITKNIWVGTPIVNNHAQSMGEFDISSFCQSDYYSAENELMIDADGMTSGFMSRSNYEWNIVSNNFGYHTFGNRISIQPYKLGYIAFSVKAKNECGWSDFEDFQYPVIKCGSNNHEIRLSPNLTRNSVEIELLEQQVEEITDTKMVKASINAEKGTLTITNTFGLVVKSQQFHGNKMSVNVDNLNKGVYTVTIIKGDKKYSSKLIKE